MAIVIDSSAILALAMADEDAALAEAAVRAIVENGGLAPARFWYEVRNVLVISELRGRVTPDRTQSFLNEVAELPIELEFPPPSPDLLTLAGRHALTVYDAAYLELTLRTGSSLATLDGKLRNAVTAAGGALFEE